MLVSCSISPASQAPMAAQTRPRQARLARPGTAVLRSPPGAQLSRIPPCTALQSEAFSSPPLARKREIPQNEKFCGEGTWCWGERLNIRAKEKKTPSHDGYTASKTSAPILDALASIYSITTYRTLRHNLSPIFHVCTGEKARQEEGRRILV